MQDPQKAPADPREEYARRLDARRTALASREKLHRTLGYFRLLILFAAAAIAFAAFAPGALAGWWLFVPAAVFWWLGGRLQRVENERSTLSRAVTFYERALARLDGIVTLSALISIW